MRGSVNRRLVARTPVGSKAPQESGAGKTDKALATSSEVVIVLEQLPRRSILQPYLRAAIHECYGQIVCGGGSAPTEFSVRIESL